MATILLWFSAVVWHCFYATYWRGPPWVAWPICNCSVSTNSLAKNDLLQVLKMQHLRIIITGVPTSILICAVLCLLSQSCPTLCNPMNCSPPGSSVHGILQARILEWVAMSSPGDLPNPGKEPRSPSLQAVHYRLSHQGLLSPECWVKHTKILQSSPCFNWGTTSRVGSLSKTSIFLSFGTMQFNPCIGSGLWNESRNSHSEAKRNLKFKGPWYYSLVKTQ